MSSRIDLSVIVTVVGKASLLRRCLTRLCPQLKGRAIEVIVPVDRTASWVTPFRQEFPDVHFVDAPARQPATTPAAAHDLYDRRRALALNLARGEILAMLDDSAAPDPDWCDRILEAHRLPHGAIGGCVEYEGQSALGLALCLQDFGRYQRPLAEGPADSLTDINVSYKRDALWAVRDSWGERYSEATVHGALARKGIPLWLCPRIVVRQDRGRLTFETTLRERFCWGRLFGSVRARELSLTQRFLLIALCPFLPVLLLMRVARKTLQTPRRAQLLLVLPYLVWLIPAWCLGEFLGYLTGREASA